MKPVPRALYKMPAQVMFMTVVPIFYFLFILAYKPFDMQAFLDAGSGRFTLNLIIGTLIVLGVTALSRMLLFLLKRILDLNWPLYALWCLGEVVLSGLFLSIPMGIGWAGIRPYFSVMSLCILYNAGILVYPLAVLSMGIQLGILSRRAATLPHPDERTLIRFHDDQKRLKLVVSSESLLYIEAEENYVHIVHLDNGRVKDFTLRSSMRVLEEPLLRHGLVRCHRSYFLNPAHVDLLKKDANGYALAQLDRDGVKAIPVSKRYYEAVTRLL